TLVDTAANPDFFKSGRANPAFSNWDFTHVWAAFADGYPSFIPSDDGDGISLADEEAGPNAGDANGDGTADAAQGNVTSFPDTVSAHPVGVKTSCGVLADVGAQAEAGAGSSDVAYTYPAGLVHFAATGCTPGATATITHY